MVKATVSRDTQDKAKFAIEASRAVVPYWYHAPYPEDSEYRPHEYQHAGVEYSLARNHSIIGDEPGVGKTCQAILISNAISAKRTLVVCPASLRLNWEREIWRWSTTPNVKTYVVSKASDGVSHEADYVIISYALLSNTGILDAIMDLGWDHLILDEAHALKDPKGNTRTRVICAPDCIPSVVGRITMASGTLLPNQPIECYNAVRLLDWDAIGRMSVDAFRDHYYDLGGGFVNIYNRGLGIWETKYSKTVRNVPRYLDDLQFRLRSKLMIRRLKAQVLHELPPKQWHPFPLSITSEMRTALKHPGWAMADKMYNMDPDAFNAGIPVDGAVATARRMLGEAKAPAVIEYINELLQEGVEKIIVSAWNHTVLDLLREGLKKHGLVYMDGRTSAAKKQKAVDQFQGSDEFRIILGQTQVIGEGWTLTKAQDAVLAEPDWVPGRNDQFLDRLHRQGQKGSYVLGHIPVVPGTMDERILATAIEKDYNIYQALDAQ